MSNFRAESRHFHRQRNAFVPEWKSADDFSSPIYCSVWSSLIEFGARNVINLSYFKGTRTESATGKPIVTDYIRASTNYWKKEA